MKELTIDEFLNSKSVFNDEGIGLDTEKLIEQIVMAYKSEKLGFKFEETKLASMGKPNYWKVMINAISYIKGLSATANVVYYAICSDLPYITSSDLELHRGVLLKRIQVIANAPYKLELSKRCGITVKSVERCIQELTKCELLLRLNTNLRTGIYYVNPKYVLRGVDDAQHELIKELVILYNGEECFKIKCEKI